MNVSVNCTDLLRAWRAGDASVELTLTNEIYATLKAMARGRIRGDSPATLNPTALVHEAVARLLDANENYESRAHFFALAALQMRAVLVDYSRRRGAMKRGGGVLIVTLDEDLVGGEDEQRFLELHDALDALARVDARTARVLELTHFGGMTAAQVAAVLGISDATVERDISFARAWLRRTLQP